MATRWPIPSLGVTGPVAPSGGLNPGIVSVSGQRETANGFYVNGSDVQERMNGGTGVVPDLDSIEEFRLLTNNFDPEYGNYNGGIVNVVTKSGADVFRGNAFEFFRNTHLTPVTSSRPSAPNSSRTSLAAPWAAP